MADAVEETPQASVSASKKKAGRQNKKQKIAANHPKVSEMVNSAILNLKERNGSSLQAIKKYIASTYKVDVDKLASFIRKYLKSAVASGTLIQTKGKGASGSFKLGGSMKSEKSEVKPQKSPPAKAKASKPAPAKPKVVKEKTKKAKSPKKSTKEKVRKTPSKAKAPKPKKAPSKSAKPPTKAAPKQEASGETEQNIVTLD